MYGESESVMVKRRRKFSLNERYSYHSKKSGKAFASAKDSKSAYDLFKRRDIAYSVGFTDGIDGSTQFSTVRKCGGNEKAYESGVKAGVKALDKSKRVKF